MERVAFLVERTGERLGCLLNPESVVVRRLAGLHPRHSTSGPLTGAGLKDDPLLYTGGGTTELTLDLLFDVTLAGSSIVTSDVRDLTRPLFELAEGTSIDGGYVEPPVIRFLWGKHWNVPAVVVAVAERLEHFTPEGAPRRSWLRMRLVRVSEPGGEAAREQAGPAAMPALLPVRAEPAEARVHEVLGGGTGPEEDIDADRASTERLDEIAYRYFRDPRLWRLVATFNNIDDPLHIPPGRLLDIPPVS